MSKHTPGPWKVRKGFCSETYEVYPAKVNGKARPPKGMQWSEIATVEKDVGKGFSGMANARLIAAAPDLLEALIECLTCEFAVTERTAIEKAEAAIAKATGEKA